ncbi:MAG: DUF4386 domain-containing protein [Gemmatimonadaceae bacterium]
MTRTANARLAGVAFLFYIAVGLTGMAVSGRATSGEGMAAKLANIAEHATDMRIYAVLVMLMSFCALVLGVTLYAITRDQDPELAMIGMTCRVIEAVNGATSIKWTLGLVWLATATGANAASPESAQGLGAFILRDSATVSATFFAVGSTLFSWLLLRGRMIPAAMARLGVAASVLLVLVLPLQLGGLFIGWLAWLQWMPMLVFELWLSFWFLFKGVAKPVTPLRSA